MGAPTDPFLERLAGDDRTPQPPTNAPTAEFLRHESVRRFAESLADLAPEERGRRLAIVEEFATFVDRDPDTMVREIYNRETRKYRKRGFYSDNAKAFGALLDGPAHLQLARSNVIRSFFIANGFRLPPERPSWM
jgi:hypothetical protein